MRTVKQIIDTQDVMMGEVKVGQPLPTPGVRQISPFLLLHHLGPINIEPGENPMDIGPHPHRGFAPVTFVFQGQVSHADSLGNQRIVSTGGVQWMSAGKGIVHSESIGEDLVETGGPYEIIQLWINLPSSQKMSEPSYQPFDAEEIPCFQDEHKKINLNIICGQYHDLKGPVVHPTPVEAFTMHMKKGSTITIPSNPDWNLLIYQLGGESIVSDANLKGRQLAQFNYNDSTIPFQAVEDSRFLMVSAPSINEPLAQYGPFVMNRPEELQAAIRDYQEGKMGYL